MSLEEIIENTEDLEVDGTPKGGVKNEVRTGSYRGRKVFMKYSGPENFDAVKRGFEASRILYSSSNIRVSEPVKLIERENESLAVYEDLDIHYPEREKWKDEDFCRNKLKKAIAILEETKTVKT